MKANARIAKITISLLVIVAAFVLGRYAGDLFAAINRKDFREIRTLQTKELLNDMGTIQVGDTLPDHIFQGLDRQYYRLSDLLERQSALIVFDYHCSNCLSEIEEIKKVTSDSTESKYFLLISRSNPLQLMELQEKLGISCRILFDEDGMFLSNLNISTYPFNIFVNQQLKIEGIMIGPIFSDEMKRVIQYNRGNDKVLQTSGEIDKL